MFKATSTPAHVVQELRELALDAIEPNPLSRVRYSTKTALQDLAGSIGEHGVLQPVLVRPLSRRQVRTDRGGATLARGEDRGLGDDPRARIKV